MLVSIDSLEGFFDELLGGLHSSFCQFISSKVIWSTSLMDSILLEKLLEHRTCENRAIVCNK